MTIPTMLERTDSGFRASTTAAPQLVAVGPTAADALTALQSLIAARTGGRDRAAGVPTPDGDSPFAAPIGDDPWFPEFLAACAANRLQADAPPLDQAG